MQLINNKNIIFKTKQKKFFFLIFINKIISKLFLKVTFLRNY